MFEPIISGRIDTMGIQFEIVHDEVEQLNKAAFDRKYDISKLSFNAFTKVTDEYQLLSAGAALGKNCGPILIAKNPIPLAELADKTIAIPGVNTTANLMMSLALPHANQKEIIVFSDIEEAVLSGKVDAGLIIHESRFTYKAKGLKKLLDVGEYWEEETKTPIPLGGITIAKDLNDDIKQKVNSIVAASVAYAFEYPKSGIAYIKEHAQEMDENVMFAHINLYVNEYSKDLGKEGRSSIRRLFEKMQHMGHIVNFNESIFVQT